ncbi:hypothetical protein F9C07_8310 [Aspergillus flavus]|uniref:Uncharacterized protein n=1 Tax=Aspergillus flavus (strain ATCC 200026 / FGSC A1120 / IAM 13836 / NRRL 3357 / JCM 12722 / SRRC 167) TaxID=332952 RepID=A0A7U2N2J6_ASPFN|nr:hypothetical protein F9C07_8310 [Aspergillus flavus]
MAHTGVSTSWVLGFQVYINFGVAVRLIASMVIPHGIRWGWTLSSEKLKLDFWKRTCPVSLSAAEVNAK